MDEQTDNTQNDVQPTEFQQAEVASTITPQTKTAEEAFAIFDEIENDESNDGKTFNVTYLNEGNKNTIKIQKEEITVAYDNGKKYYLIPNKNKRTIEINGKLYKNNLSFNGQDNKLISVTPATQGGKPHRHKRTKKSHSRRRRSHKKTRGKRHHRKQ